MMLVEPLAEDLLDQVDTVKAYMQSMSEAAATQAEHQLVDLKLEHVEHGVINEEGNSERLDRKFVIIRIS